MLSYLPSYSCDDHWCFHHVRLWWFSKTCLVLVLFGCRFRKVCLNFWMLLLSFLFELPMLVCDAVVKLVWTLELKCMNHLCSLAIFMFWLKNFVGITWSVVLQKCHDSRVNPYCLYSESLSAKIREFFNSYETIWIFMRIKVFTCVIPCRNQFS